jgi:CubicO group peptidase (beta-lactamase class C family)
MLHRFDRRQSRGLLVLLIAACASMLANAAEVVFPGAAWETKAPEEVGLDEARLEAVARALGTRGCAVKNGYVVKTWGAQDQRADLFSSAKPVLSTLLMFAAKEGRVKSFDQPIVDFGWPLAAKDRTITLRHLASMTSGYARPEGPGTAWAYNDYAIQLYQQTLFDKIFQAPPQEVFRHAQRFGALQLQDGFTFRKKNRRMEASVRDFARVVWFWLNRGNWNGKQLVPRSYFDDNMRPQVAADLALSSDAPTNDYLGIGTYGGESNHFSTAGPGIYGFNWWFNAKGGTHPDTLTWPDAPPDTVMSLGHRGNCSAMIPSLNFIVVAADANWGELKAGKAESPLNKNLKMIAAAGTQLDARNSASKSAGGR